MMDYDELIKALRGCTPEQYCEDKACKTRTGKLRSKTFQGIADAMAEQWGSLEVQE